MLYREEEPVAGEPRLLGTSDKATAPSSGISGASLAGSLGRWSEYHPLIQESELTGSFIRASSEQPCDFGLVPKHL